MGSSYKSFSYTSIYVSWKHPIPLTTSLMPIKITSKVRRTSKIIATEKKTSDKISIQNNLFFPMDAVIKKNCSSTVTSRCLLSKGKVYVSTYISLHNYFLSLLFAVWYTLFKFQIIFIFISLIHMKSESERRFANFFFCSLLVFTYYFFVQFFFLIYSVFFNILFSSTTCFTFAIIRDENEKFKARKKIVL